MAKTQIKVFGFDHKVVDEAAKKLVSLAVATKNKFVGPIPMPTKREEVTILRSVHVNKKSREQFESRTHQRLVVLENPSSELLDKLKRLELPAGVGLKFKEK
ncbi:30S ribosomal protein S10 [Mycoplasmopsis synoviae]|uniref:Small ribosomal subunit protein uS10 n=2 Tax=Mycoplasmopsis synoviae TaxID=2109 RepID=RS10_MYCS5|nr:30S ribosomal protein S10 [Mycoplasmopsis synoviae]Q4A5C0.2 RecName: Full=Small ribosomal subunit protein uS10; AltName: Full=30S ribosomal protein S10 [Mycoplasmopsis synoviae 53]AKB11361.1 30S ribosomal protein S10 [Mycoplasmopsis synoviae ATCC 25204]AKJ20867.1 SSU ribosomal protein S10p (S20e) [Mycoplasmopsis synoviae]AQU48192.1 SSU ribosomal protein S10p (S20e) [Mycoplasmopsis synoviae]AWL84407.1 30S ribosomal protein S10 [Mycoplasmopsis synoviae]MBD5789003.1 30S ribosomal protein S10 